MGLKKCDKVILILGMHRSGTSCLAGSLERCGLYLGKVRRKGGRFNKKGLYESKDLQTLHDRILALNRLSWVDPYKASVVLHQRYRRDMTKLAVDLKSKVPSGIKDPRTLLLINDWEEILGTSNHLKVGTFRHPLAVADSLKKRNGLTIEEGLKLWRHYNLILLNTHKTHSFPLIEYGRGDKEHYLQQIKNMTAQIGLRFNKFRLKFFISESLCHHRYKQEEVPDSCEEVYQYLRAHSLSAKG